MVDAYSLNLTTGALTKNGTAVANLIDVEVALRFNNAPGIIEGAPATLAVGFSLVATIHDVAADARILAQGPAGLLGTSVQFFAGTPARFRFVSKLNDTLVLTNAGTITASYLNGPSLVTAQP